MRLADRVRYLMERLLVRGVPYRLLLVAGILVGIAVGGGVLAFAIGAFDSLGEAVWWAFLHLSDPGYLGDDEGAALRTIATVVTLLGYVFFVGALVAVMTQWLNETIRDLERGLTPIADEDHLLVLGWTSRTPVIVEELLRAEERVKRFLARRGARRFRIVVLAEQVDMGLLDTLRTRAGEHWDEHRVILRAGSALVYDHLERAAFRRASAVILPGAAYPNASDDDTDERIVKTLALIGHYLHAAPDRAEPPALIAEVFDKRSLGLAARVYTGDRRMVVSDAVSGQLVAQALLQPGLAQVFTELLTFGATSEVYIVEHAEAVGMRFGEVQARFPKAAVLGLVRPNAATANAATAAEGFTPLLAPPTETRVEPGDRIAVVAAQLSHTDLAATPPTPATMPPARPKGATRAALPVERRVLMLGWSHRAPAILEALAAMPSASIRVDVVAPNSVEDRERSVIRSGYDLSGLDLRYLHGDPTVAADLAPLDLGAYTNVLLVATTQASGATSDARTIYAYVLLRDLLDEAGLTGDAAPAVLIELTDEDNAVLYDDDPAEIILSPLMVSHMLAHVALRRELLPVYEALFQAGGPQLRFRPASRYGLTRRPLGVDALRHAAAQRGEVFLGVRLHAERNRRSGVRLHPPRSFSATLTADDDLLVLVNE
ncbi:MAG: hypothetical protein AAFP18_02555 [Bacteroidota bacterium]